MNNEDARAPFPSLAKQHDEIKAQKYCCNSACPFKDCDFHLCHAPRGFAVTTVNMDATCRRYIDYLAQEAAKQERISKMTLGEAVGIFCGIAELEISDEEKGAAIWKVLNMETHNGIPKKAMLEVIRYLMGLCFDIEEEAEP